NDPRHVLFCLVHVRPPSVAGPGCKKVFYHVHRFSVSGNPLRAHNPSSLFLPIGYLRQRNGRKRRGWDAPAPAIIPACRRCRQVGKTRPPITNGDGQRRMSLWERRNFMAEMREAAVSIPGVAQATELSLLVELEARWENLRHAPARGREAGSATQDLLGIQKA